VCVRALGRFSTAVLLVGCSPLPDADREGRRVRVGSDVVEQVCGGTLTRLDAEVDTIEDRLGLPHERDPVRVFVLSDAVYDQYCGGGAHGCYHASIDRVVLRDDTFEESLTHELAHAVAWRQPGSWAPVFFAEGLATAIALPRCGNPHSDVLDDIDELLASDGGYEWSSRRNVVASRLIAWLIRTHGPTKVFEFMGALHRGQHPDSIRKVYLQHFGTWLDADLLAHWKDDVPLTAAEAGFLAPVVGPTDDIARFSLSGNLDCDSPRVHNDFEQPELGWVEWTIVIDDPSHGGYYSVIGDIPEGTVLAYQWADCLAPEWASDGWYELDAERAAHLYAGHVQRIRWSGPLGSAALEIELQGRCDPRRQNCPAGLVCSQGGECRPLVDAPAGLGEPCEEGEDSGPLACELELVCIGDAILDGSPEGSCHAGCAWDSKVCPSGMICDPGWEFCAPLCDPLAQDCDSGHTCYPSEGNGICVPSENLGVWEPCDVPRNWSSGFACAPGLVCKGFVGCPSEDEQGCCVPLCDPQLEEPSCPPDLPQCADLKSSDWGACTP
jgi:hypothetical protein